MEFQLRCKIWLENKGDKVFGDGPWDLLKRVERLGSLRQAAAEINMSYSQAWHLISTLEKNLGYPLLAKKAGGAKGGYSVITSEGICILRAYDNFRREAQESLESLFEKHFEQAFNNN